MFTLPQLIEEDIQQIDSVLEDLLERTEATTALVADKGGFLITSRGDSGQFDLTTIAALASGAFMANQTIANLVQESSFNNVYQQGEKNSMFVISIDEHCLLIVIFEAHLSVGVVKYFARPTVYQIATQIETAHKRDPGAGLNLSELNVADASGFFKKKD